MKPKTMILMGLAVTCGLGASYMTSQLLADRQQPEVEKVEILVARRNLSVGESIKKPEDLFEKKLVTLELEPKDAIKNYDVLKNKIMKQNLRPGDHITMNELYGDGDSLPIPEGYKAVGLRVNLETGISGFATLPHSRVNIIQTVRNQDVKSSFAHILLQDVLVLAADTQIDRQSGIAAPASIVTFALTDDDILKVNLAKELGALSLSLRKPNDRTKTTQTRITGQEIYGKEETKPEPVVVAPKQETKVVEAPPVVEEGPVGVQFELNIINGSSQQRTTFLQTPDGQVLEQDAQVTRPPQRQQKAPVAPPQPKGKLPSDVSTGIVP